MTEIRPKSSKRQYQLASLNWDKCLCHVENVLEPLVSFSEKSWSTFEKCAKMRRDAIWNQLEGHWQDGPRGFYHRKCYQIYTDKSKVERAMKHQANVEDNIEYCDQAADQATDQATEPPGRRLSRSQLDKFNKDRCAICQKDKMKKGTRSREPLTLNMTDTGSSSLTTAAQIRNDQRLLKEIRYQDTIALEIKYHKSCYREYVRLNSLESVERQNCEEEDAASGCYNRAFDRIKELVRMKVLQGAQALKMSELLKEYIVYLNEEGVNACNYRSSKLKSRLKKFFGDSLAFQQPINKSHSEIVYSAHVTTGEVVETIMNACVQDHSDNEEMEIDIASDDQDNEVFLNVYHAAKSIRTLVTGMKVTMPWPPIAEDLDCETTIVPDLLYNMLAWICSPSEFSCKRVSDVAPDIDRIILSFAQDLIYSITRGRIKTPKHVTLPLTVKSLTGNAELITMLNRLGHGLSYTQVEEMETALAEKEVQKTQDGILVPSTCSVGVPAVFCWDNNDLLEETLSGKGTTHCTNGIVIQRKPLTCALPPHITDDRSRRSKNRSLNLIPTDVLLYHSGNRQGPCPLNIRVADIVEFKPETGAYAKAINFGWMICRQPVQDTIFTLDDSQTQVLPAWAGFNIKLQEDLIPRESSIGYCQVIEASPTEMPTVYTILQRSLQMASQLGQQDAIVVVDQPIYAKALEVTWQNKEEFNRLVLRMGAFHIICAFMSAIGKRFGDAGLSDVLMESGVVGAGSIAGVLEGRHYNRGLRTHKIIFEALHRLQWRSFKSWLEGKGYNSRYIFLTNAVQDIRKQFSPEKFNNLLTTVEFVQIFDLYEEYQKEDIGPMKSFWNSYQDMVSLMLSFIRATREGNWSLHLECIKQMIPWFFAYDHVNYARYLPIYLIHMMKLPETHPEAQMMLENGDFGVQRTTAHGFSQLPVDQTIEQTLNRSTKTKGSIVGFSLRKNAVQRWLLTAHSRAAFVDKCRMMTANTKQIENRLHKETGNTRIKRDEDDVRKVMEVVSNWNNPFEESVELVSIGSGSVASSKVKEDLLTARQKGTYALTTFVEERLLSNNTGFHDTLTKLKLGTFSDARKKTSLVKDGKTVILKADRNLFARLLVIGQSRKMDLRELLVHELGPLPWSLASFDGSLAKTNKAVLSKLIEDGVEFPQNLPVQASAIIIDAMAMLQTLCKIPDRFSNLAEIVLNRMLNHAGEASRIDFVGDQYPSVSIKNIEREKRGSGGHLIVNITSPQQLCPRQWKKFMSSGKNKEGLLMFLVNEWSTNQEYVRKIDSRQLFITHGNQCTKLEVLNGRVHATEALELYSTQEEADTRMFLHASHASNNGHQRVVIFSSDTDVEVLACHHQVTIQAELTLISGTKSRLRLIAIPRLCDKLGPDMCHVLPGLHALTGCDTISAFAGRGKKKALELARGDEVVRRNVQVLGESVPITEADMVKVEEVVCRLYNERQITSVNELRYRMFCKGSNVHSQQLPPTSAALKQHIRRANYQAHIWRRALHPETNVSPVNQGWELRDGHLEIVWTNLMPAPEAVMELVCCGCKGACQTRRCSCVRNGLPCTDACTCNDQCVNCNKDQGDYDDDDDDDDDAEEDEDDNEDPVNASG